MSGGEITIVSGLPRSGTSLMMQMLQAGGMPVLTDERRAPDEHNPRGYFEHEAVKHGRDDLSWLENAGGKAVKVIHLLLAHLPADRVYRVIFLTRNLEEVIASQRTMLKKQGRVSAALADDKLAAVYEKQVATARKWLSERPNFSVLYVNYKDLIGRPAETVGQINSFLGGQLRVNAMAGAIEPALYRERKS